MNKKCSKVIRYEIFYTDTLPEGMRNCDLSSKVNPKRIKERETQASKPFQICENGGWRKFVDLAYFCNSESELGVRSKQMRSLTAHHLLNKNGTLLSNVRKERELKNHEH